MNQKHVNFASQVHKLLSLISSKASYSIASIAYLPLCIIADTQQPYTQKWAELVVSLWTGGRDEETFPAPPHFSWKPCDETKAGGRKRNALCDVCYVCVIHVSCLRLTASLPCVKSFSGCGMVCGWSVFLSILVCSTRTFPLSLSLWL